jgi:hypothetical protein
MTEKTVMVDDLPPLPWAHDCLIEDNGTYTAIYTGQQMADYARAAIEAKRAEIERQREEIARLEVEWDRAAEVSWRRREAMRMALEALEELQGGCTDTDDGTVEAITVWCPEVIDALRAVLEEK